ncbi:hypothetical protein TcBrA4_0077480 [Trypanosoma cruzi]|nr:hypothetical protein TcBrA4_0077480 [Trypanosoma cruzi]
MVQLAGLSRAYAVLRQLELLRQQDVLDPLPPDTETETEAGSNLSDTGRGNGKTAGAPTTLTDCCAAGKGPRLESSPIITTAAKSSGEGSRENTTHAPQCTETYVKDLLSLQERMSHHSVDSPMVGNRERERRLVEAYSYDTTESVTSGRRLSPHPSMDGRAQALQRVLQEIVARRRQAGENAVTPDHDDVHKLTQQDPYHRAGVAFRPSGRCSKKISSRLLSPSRGTDGEEDVFFDESPLSFGICTRGTPGREAGQRIYNSHEKSSADEEETRDDVPHAQEEEEREEYSPRAIPLVYSPPRGRKDLLTYSAVSEYTKSLLRQRRQRHEKIKAETLQQQRCRTADAQRRLDTTPLNATLSPIACIENPDKDVSYNLSRNLEFDSLQDETVIPPLPLFIQELLVMGSAEMQEKLRGMEGCCNGPAMWCRDWFALTALVNSPDAIRHVILPLLLLELLEQNESNEQDASDANSRMSHILCALIGLGGLAAGVLSLLLDMLTKSLGCPRLVALAIRAVGGDEGLHALCRLARCEQMDQGVHTAAVYGIGTLAYPALGHTDVYCVGAPGLNGTIVFYQPPVLVGYVEVGNDGERRRETSLQCPPPYRPTHVILSAELVRNKLLQFTVSRNFRRATGIYETLPLVLRDFARDAPEACRLQGLSDDVQETLRRCALELDDVSHFSARVLPFSYDPHYAGRKEEVFAVEEVLMNVLYNPKTTLGVVEQTLVSIASLPDFATAHAAFPVLDYVIKCVTRFEREGDAAVEGEKAVLVAGLVALGRLLRNEGTPPAVIDTACVVLLHNLDSSSCRLRHAACIGLGEVGAVVNNPGVVARALTDALSDAAMNHETVAWALTRLGLRGVRVLLDQIAPGDGKSSSRTSGDWQEKKNGSRHHAAAVLPISTRMICARALGKVDFLTVSLGIHEDARRLQEELVRRLAAAITSAQMEEELALECSYALAEAVSINLNGKTPTPCRDEEAASYYRSETLNEAFQVLKGLVDSVPLPLSVNKALFYSICLYGGAHGELYASQTAIQAPLVALRAAATFGLRACGGRVIRTVVMALNDDDAAVRVEAFDTLDAVGVKDVLRVLRTRPQKHTQQVIAALRDSLLRDMGRGAKRQAARDLYAALLRA